MQVWHAPCCVVCSAFSFVVMEDLSIWMSSELCIACSVTAMMSCCSYAVLCAVCMQLDAGHALLCAAVLPVCSCALVCSAVCVALLCCALCCILLCYVCCVRMNSCVVWLAGLPCFQETLLCAGLPCYAVLCPPVRWNRKVIPRGTSPRRMHKIFKSHTIWMAF